MDIEIKDLSSLDDYLTATDNFKNAVYISKPPQICKEEACVLGIDEAGRGPVLGPMVYGVAFCPLAKAEILDIMKCEDSKVLTEEKREIIFTKICEASDTMGFATDVISPNTISNSMYSRAKVSLNDVSVNSAIELIRKVKSVGVKIAQIFVDTVGPPEKYEKYLSALFPEYLITVAKKADSTFPIVSAASICAKVTRDHALKVWKFENGLDAKEVKFGCGYPSDPATKYYLRNYMDPVFGFPHLVRFSWSTTENILEENAYHVEWESLEVPNKATVNNTKISSFFKAFSKDGTEEAKPKHKFFTERCLKSVTEF